MSDARILGDPGTAAFQVDKYPFYFLNRLVSRYNIVITARLRSIGLDVPAWRVLMILGEKAPRGVREIADAAVVNLSTMTRIIQRMNAAGLIHCVSSPEDARVTEVSLLPPGEQKLQEARACTAPIYARAIDGFSETDFRQMIALVDRMRSNLDAITDD